MASRTRHAEDELSMVVHELRNPLVGIDAAARVLARDLGTHPAAKRASAVAAEARHLLDLLESVSEADAAAHGRLRSVLRPIDLAAVVRDAVEGIHLDRHAISLRGTDAPVAVEADPSRIRQVLKNLLANAAQYSPEGSPIEVVVRTDARRCRATVEVRDRGPGIPARERARLFRKFARLSTADGTRGSGLGLYISRAIVEDHGGVLRYEPTADGGNAFLFHIPMTGKRVGHPRQRRSPTRVKSSR